MQDLSGLPDRSIECSDNSLITEHESRIDLTDLPDLVLRRILDFLLTAAEVRLSRRRDKNFYQKYGFHTAIMRTSKYLYSLASHVFTANHFILVSSDDCLIRQALFDWRVWVWRRFDMPYQDCKLRIHVSKKKQFSPIFRLPAQNRVRFMVCLDNLDDLLRLLRNMEFMHAGETEYKLELKPSLTGNALPLMIQRKLLLPVATLRGDSPTSAVSGLVDESLARTLRESLTSTIHWHRSDAWTFYGLALSQKKIADQAFVTDNIDAAHDLYHNIAACIRRCTEKDIISTGLDDANLLRSFDLLQYATSINLAITKLRQIMQRGQTRRRLHEGLIPALEDVTIPSWFQKERSAEYALLRGLGSFAVGADDDAIGSLCDVTEVVPTNKRYAAALKYVSSWLERAPDQMTQTHRMDMLKEMVWLLPKGPMRAKLWRPKSISASLDWEMYVLNGLNYKGRGPKHVEQKPGYSLVEGREVPVPFNKGDADAFITAQRKKLAAYEDKWQKPMVLHVGCLLEGPEDDEAHDHGTIHGNHSALWNFV